MAVEFRRFVAADADLLAEFLTGEDWPYFAGGPGPEADRIREQVAAGGRHRSCGAGPGRPPVQPGETPRATRRHVTWRKPL